MTIFRSIYKRVVRSITVPLLTRLLAFLDGKRWMPVFFLLLTRMNTNDLMLLQVLHNIQVKTGRKVFIISAWPIWPLETGKDPFIRSFITELTPKISYLWIPGWLHILIRRYTPLILRVLQVQNILNRPMGLNATFRFTDSSTMFGTDILSQGSRALLKIPKSHEHVLEGRLRQLGVGAGRWYVCVHARENGWTNYTRAYGLKNPTGYRLENDEYRNVDIKTYIPAIHHIIDMGGIVVRMGDPSMEPMDGIDGLIDYPFTPQRSLPMDLYLVANSRFVIGCEAGFTSNFPVAFGPPLLLTNLSSTAMTANWPYDNTRVLMKPVREVASGRILDLRERSQPRLLIHHTGAFREMGYQWLPNTPEDILEATKEMLALVESDSFGAPMTEEQEYFDGCAKEALSILIQPGTITNVKWSYQTDFHSRVSSTFASRYYREEACQEQVSHNSDNSSVLSAVGGRKYSIPEEN